MANAALGVGVAVGNALPLVLSGPRGSLVNLDLTTSPVARRNVVGGLTSVKLSRVRHGRGDRGGVGDLVGVGRGRGGVGDLVGVGRGRGGDRGGVGDLVGVGRGRPVADLGGRTDAVGTGGSLSRVTHHHWIGVRRQRMHRLLIARLQGGVAGGLIAIARQLSCKSGIVMRRVVRILMGVV